jgi:ATP-dependent DNA ligase
MDYIIFDVVTKDIARHRLQLLDLIQTFILIEGIKHVKISKSKMIHDENELLKYNNEVVSDGYEGLIARNINGQYQPGVRSKHSLKVK